MDDGEYLERYDVKDRKPFDPSYKDCFIFEFVKPGASYADYRFITQLFFDFLRFCDIHAVSKPHYGNWLTPVESRKNIILWQLPGCDPNYGIRHDEEIIPFDSRNETLFFWNLDDYPVPADTDLATVRKNIAKAFQTMGFHWKLSLFTDCKQPENVQQATNYMPKLSGTYREAKEAVPTLDMTLYMLLLAQDDNVNVAVLVKPDCDPNSDLRRILHCLASRGHDVLLVMPPPDEEFRFGVESLIVNSRFVGGGVPRACYVYQPAPTGYNEFFNMFGDYDDEDEEDVDKKDEDVDEEDDVSHLPNSMMVDFSEPIRLVKASRTVIFWDAMDCPFPLSLSPDQIFQKIKTALVGRGYSDNITIWAYIRKGSSSDKYLGDKTWDSRIYFLSGGDKALRRVRMLNDMHLMSRDAPLTNHGASLILVSDHFFHDPYYMEMLGQFMSGGYALVLVSNMSESLDEWPGALDRARHFGVEGIRVLKQVPGV